MPQGYLFFGFGYHFVPVLQLSAARVHEASQHHPSQLFVLVGHVILHDVDADAVGVDVGRVDGEGEALVEDEDGRHRGGGGGGGGAGAECRSRRGFTGQSRFGPLDHGRLLCFHRTIVLHSAEKDYILFVLRVKYVILLIQ